MVVPRRLRADAARNRAKVLEVAYDTFAKEGLAVPIDVIAARAGVGAGTVYRHFPTKEALFQAIVEERVRLLADSAEVLGAAEDAGEAFFTFLWDMVEEGQTDQGLVDALAGIGFDIDAVAPGAAEQFMGILSTLLARAQQAGAVRADIDVKDVKSLLVGCHAMQRHACDAGATRRLLGVLKDGLAAARTGILGP